MRSDNCRHLAKQTVEPWKEMNRFHIRRKEKLKLKKQNLCWKQGLLLVEMAVEEVKQIASLRLTFLLWYIVFGSCRKKVRRELISLDGLIPICA